MINPSFDYDVIIVGAGPAGTACAYMLAHKGYRIALLDKSDFPRDKTCGDALSLDVINQLEWMNPELLKAFHSYEHKTASFGIKIVAPSGEGVELPILRNQVVKCGFTSERFYFDDFLFQQVQQKGGVDIFTNTEITGITINKDAAVVQCSQKTFTTSLVIGADGAHSVVNKNTIGNKTDKKHHSAGIRQYYENVTGFHPENYIELHFLPEITPGYLWIFPLPNNKANVGLGIPSAMVSKQKINLNKTFQHLLQTHPSFKERFKQAVPLETIKGFGLPLGSKKRKISGQRVLLTGDAAGLIDPFTGEGIANALRSGRVAADVALQALQQNTFTAAFLVRYDQLLYSKIGNELRISARLQNMFRHKRLVNFMIKKANRSAYLKQHMCDALANVHQRKRFTGLKVLYHLLVK